MQKENTNLELQKCPFCGGEEIQLDKKFNGFLVCCKKCKCNTGTYSTKEKAISAWNTRTFKSNVHLEHKKIEISKVDCCDVCFEEYRFSPKKMQQPILKISANGKTIRLCKNHIELLKQELTEN